MTLSKRIGLDVGEATTTVYVRGEGVIVHEPSRGRTEACRRDQVLQLIRRVQGFQRLFKPEVMICVSPQLSLGPRCELTETAIEAGARQAWLIEKPLAAAIGAGLPVEERTGMLVCDIGAGTTEIAALFGCSTIASRTLAVGGSRLDEAIGGFLEHSRGCRLDREQAEQVKLAAGAAVPIEPVLKAVVGDREVTSNELAATVQPVLAIVAAGVAEVLEQAPKGVVERMRGRGLTLTGGSAQLPGIDRFMWRHLGLPVRVARDPETCAARGAGEAPERLDVLRHSQGYVR